LTAYPPSVIIQVIKIGFGISVAMSFPLVVFPCRTAIHSLMFRKTGYTAASSDMLGANYIPPKRFNLITIIVIGVTLGTFFYCLFVCIAAKPQVMGPGLTKERPLIELPSRILINSLRCDTTPVANSCNQHYHITLGGHPSKY
jgi:hypothetical protein